MRIKHGCSMTTIQYFSDIHNEYNYLDPESIINYDADVVVAAGDIYSGSRGVEWLKTFPQPVVWVLGNHEFYSRSLKNHIRKLLKDCEGTNIHLLHNDSITINSQTFHGATLWTDYQANNNPNDYLFASTIMNDYKRIKYENGMRLYPQHLLSEHKESVRFLESSVNPGDVIVVHHSPYVETTHNHSGHIAYYASDLRRTITALQPRAVIHGHTHKPVDMNIDGVDVLNNPRGYVTKMHKHEKAEVQTFDGKKTYRI